MWASIYTLVLRPTDELKLDEPALGHCGWPEKGCRWLWLGAGQQVA